MYVIDSSVWIYVLRKGAPQALRKRVHDLVADRRAVYTCPILFEVLAGAKTNEEIAIVKKIFGDCQREVFLPEYWETAAIFYRELRAKGVVVPQGDLLVAVVAQLRKLKVLCCDKHFDLIRETMAPSLMVEFIQQ